MVITKSVSRFGRNTEEVLISFRAIKEAGAEIFFDEQGLTSRDPSGRAVFRWFLLKSLFLRRMKPVMAILLINVLFAGMHLWNLRAGAGISEILVQLIFAFCFSIWAGAVTWKSTWLIPLLAHVFLNATAGVETYGSLWE